MPLLPLFVFLKVLTGKWGSSPAGRGPCPLRHWGGGPKGFLFLEGPRWASRYGLPLGSPPALFLPRYTLYSSGASPLSAPPATSGREAVTGGEAGSPGEHESLASNQRPSKPFVSVNIYG